MNLVILFGRELNMEETFIVTGLVALVVGILLGFLVEYLFRE